MAANTASGSGKRAGMPGWKPRLHIRHTERGPENYTVWSPVGEDPSEVTQRRASLKDRTSQLGTLPEERQTSPDRSFISTPMTDVKPGYEGHELVHQGNVLGYAMKRDDAAQYRVFTGSGIEMVRPASDPGEAGEMLLESRMAHAEQYPQYETPEGVTLEPTFQDALRYGDYDFVYSNVKADMEENGELDREDPRWNADIARDFLNGVSEKGSWADREDNEVFQYVEGVVGHVRYERENERAAPRSSHYR